jgi:hypothetical protein
MWLIDLSMFGMLTLAALPVGAAQTSSPCDASAAQLEHSAPWVGGSLQLELDGAAPGASVRLFHSPSGSRLQTPFGLLELDREELGPVAGGQADANGHWAVSLAIPLDASLVEVEGHYQALVQGPVGPATLSAAVHLRYLGPRSYTLCTGAGIPFSSDPPLASMDVHAIADGRRIASIPLGTWSGYPISMSLPVFNANLALGAVLSSGDELVVFDNFACTIAAKLGVESAFPRLLTSADGRLAYVLEKPASGAARIRALDLESAAFVATLQLPDTCIAQWCMDENSSLAFVRETDPVTGAHLVRRVDLENGQVLDTLNLGSPIAALPGWLETERGWLYASAVKSASYPGFSFSAIDLAHPGAEAIVIDFGYLAPGPPVVVPCVGRLFVRGWQSLGPSPDTVYVAPQDAPQRLVDFPGPLGPFVFGGSVVRDDRVWVLSKSFAFEYSAALWNLDALALTWRGTDDSWIYPWPVTLLAARGPLVDVLLMPRTGLSSTFENFEPALIVLDGDSGKVLDSWPLSWGPLAAYVLEPE